MPDLHFPLCFAAITPAHLVPCLKYQEKPFQDFFRKILDISPLQIINQNGPKEVKFCQRMTMYIKDVGEKLFDFHIS